jgi:hypothetical protein
MAGCCQVVNGGQTSLACAHFLVESVALSQVCNSLCGPSFRKCLIVRASNDVRSALKSRSEYEATSNYDSCADPR